MTDDLFLKEMGAKVRAARKAKGLTQMELGKLCQLHDTWISMIECGRSGCLVTTLKNIADKLDRDVKDFL